MLDKYEDIKKLSDSNFKRLVGVKREVFISMLEVYEEYESSKLKLGGRPSNLSNATKLLVMLEYYREYRTQFHMSVSYGVSESTISRVIREVEKVLMKSGKFRLPGKKKLSDESNFEVEYFVVDVTESPIQRPKKNNENTIVERKKDIQ